VRCSSMRSVRADAVSSNGAGGRSSCGSGGFALRGDAAADEDADDSGEVCSSGDGLAEGLHIASGVCVRGDAACGDRMVGRRGDDGGGDEDERVRAKRRRF